MYRTVAVAVTMCGATLATQAMACETARTQEELVCQAQAENSAAVAKFQKQIRGKPAIHVQP